jgi:hypothetical protein
MVGMPDEVFVGFAHGGRAPKPVSADATGSVVGPAAGVAAVQPGGTDNLPRLRKQTKEVGGCEQAHRYSSQRGWHAGTIAETRCAV